MFSQRRSADQVAILRPVLISQARFYYSTLYADSCVIYAGIFTGIHREYVFSLARVSYFVIGAGVARIAI